MKIQGLDFPDKCPQDCPMKPYDFYHLGQSSICTRCPVFACAPMEGPDGKPDFRMVEPDDFRPDWLAEWHRFFQDGTEPELKLKMKQVSMGCSTPSMKERRDG